MGCIRGSIRGPSRSSTEFYRGSFCKYLRGLPLHRTMGCESHSGHRCFHFELPHCTQFVELSVADGSKAHYLYASDQHVPLQSCAAAVRCLPEVGVTVLSPHATIFSEHDRQQVKTARAQVAAPFAEVFCFRSACGGPEAFTTQEAGPHWVCGWTAYGPSRNAVVRSACSSSSGIQNDAPSAAEVLLTAPRHSLGLGLQSVWPLSLQGFAGSRSQRLFAGCEEGH